MYFLNDKHKWRTQFWQFEHVCEKFAEKCLFTKRINTFSNAPHNKQNSSINKQKLTGRFASFQHYYNNFNATLFENRMKNITAPSTNHKMANKQVQ